MKTSEHKFVCSIVARQRSETRISELFGVVTSAVPVNSLGQFYHMLAVHLTLLVWFKHIVLHIS